MLHERPRDLYDDLASFLGLPPFPLQMQFPRYNSIRGPRTGLCSQPDSMRVLQEHFAPEYEAIEGALATAHVPLPPKFQLRQTRCDRPEELIEQIQCEKGRCEDSVD